MPLIKQGNASSVTRGALVLDLGDLRRQATEILEVARREAASITTDARARAEQITASAHERGQAEGRAEGLADGREAGRVEGRAEAAQAFESRLDALAEAWGEALSRWEESMGGMVLAAREDVLEFAFMMATKIVHRVVAIDPSIVQEQLGEALSLLCRPSAVTVVVHPDDLALVEECLPSIVDRFPRCEHAALRTDEAMSRGGCIVRTGDGSIDATIETQIDRIARTLFPAAGSGSEPAGPPPEAEA